MTDWHPRDHMGPLAYLWFKLGGWAEVETVPEWVREASSPSKKTDIPVNGSVEAVFTDSTTYRSNHSRTVPEFSPARSSS